MVSAYVAVRWIHVMAATAWFGEVVTINFVLVPVLSRMPREEGAKFLAAVFPTIFRLASVLSATAVLSGGYLAWTRFSASPEALWTTWSGRSFLAGATIGLALTVFHFILEPRLDGLGPTLLPASALAAEMRPGQGLVARSFEGAQPGRTVTLQWRATSPNGAWFQEIGEVLRGHYVELNEAVPVVFGPRPWIRLVP